MNAMERRSGKGRDEPRSAGEAPSPARGRQRGAGADRERGAFGLLNLALFLVAVVVIVVGYWLLDRGSITAAPALLVVGYVVLIPAALLLGTGRSQEGA